MAACIWQLFVIRVSSTQRIHTKRACADEPCLNKPISQNNFRSVSSSCQSRSDAHLNNERQARLSVTVSVKCDVGHMSGACGGGAAGQTLYIPTYYPYLTYYCYSGALTLRRYTATA